MPTSIVDTFNGCLVGMRRSLALMNEDEKLVVLLTQTDDLIALYTEIASVNSAFHRRLEEGTLPVERPLAGHA
jgi:hypothetical protein